MKKKREAPRRGLELCGRSLTPHFELSPTQNAAGFFFSFLRVLRLAPGLCRICDGRQARQRVIPRDLSVQQAVDCGLWQQERMSAHSGENAGGTAPDSRVCRRTVLGLREMVGQMLTG